MEKYKALMIRALRDPDNANLDCVQKYPDYDG